MKILVTYSSKTGNTKKVAEGIYDSLENAIILPVEEVKEFDYDLIFLGGWIDRATFDQKAKDCLEKIEGRNIAYFFTLGAYPDSKHAEDCINNINLLIKEKNKLVGQYHCQGAIDPKLIQYLLTLPPGTAMSPSEERKKKWADAASHPDQNDINKVKDFAKKVIESI